MTLSAESASVLSVPSRPTNHQPARVKSTPNLRRESSGVPSPVFSSSRMAQSVEDEEWDAAEIKSIMQHGLGLATPPTTFLGVSPPRRSGGASNPIVQDYNWRSNAYVSSHSNLQALREIDARGVSFLHDSAAGAESELLTASPHTSEFGTNGSTAAQLPAAKVERCLSKPYNRVMAKPMTCQVGFNVA